MEKNENFWAENIAEKVVSRESFHFTGEKAPKPKKWSLKSSTSLSGVVHIGNLSDVVRGEAVLRALGEKGFPVEFIYVTEDMDPLRKLPKGVPASFSQYIGAPVSDVPDPFGCHDSFGKHYLEGFLSVLDCFLDSKPSIFSMRQEYRKGSFNNEIQTIMQNLPALRQILDRFRKQPLSSDWIPWKPVCDNCGKIQTTKALSFDGKEVEYVCEDYAFESTLAKGCGHKGKSLLSKANGKMPWKSEWAMQWRHWNVCSEGAGKEYESKNSSFWINAEICEKILGFPMPEPIFYEYLMIDNKKISASLGNVIYPADWLKVSRPETLRLIYLKRLMKTRSFSWNSIPLLELELDRLSQQKTSKLLHFVEIPLKRKLAPQKLDYNFAVFLGQLFSDNSRAAAKLVEMGLYSKEELKEELALVNERLSLAREFAQLHVPEQEKLSFAPIEKIPLDSISPKAKSAFPEIAQALEKAKTSEQLQSNIFAVSKSKSVSQPELFTALYYAVLGKPRGPKFGSLAFAFGKQKIAKRLKEIK